MPERHLATLNLGLATEQVTWTKREKTPATQEYNQAQIKILETLKALNKAGDATLILDAEKMILDNELRLYGNSPGMKGSLKAALLELSQAEKHHKIVRDKNQYSQVDGMLQLPKNRRGGLPYDEARQFFAAHNTRLLNQDRSRLNQTEKQTLSARRSNLRVAEKTYIALQHKALGLDADKPKARDRDIGR